MAEQYERDLTQATEVVLTGRNRVGPTGGRTPRVARVREAPVASRPVRSAWVARWARS
jgi:hypothetical protein